MNREEIEENFLKAGDLATESYEGFKKIREKYSKGKVSEDEFLAADKQYREALKRFRIAHETLENAVLEAGE